MKIGIILFSIMCFFSCGLAEEVIPKLVAKGMVYENVRVREQTPEALIIFHSRGMGKVFLRDLSPAWQRHFGYDAGEAAEFREEREEEKAARERAAEEAAARQERSRAGQNTRGPLPAGPSGDHVARVMARFGQPAKVAKKVDLRPRFRAFDLYAKSQGRRPSCSVFAVVTALEYQNAMYLGKPEKLSEEYVIWATLKTLGYDSSGTIPGAPVGQEWSSFDADAGFSLVEVVQAVKSFGIPEISEMPNTFGTSMLDISEPPGDVVRSAQSRRKIQFFAVTGRNPARQAENIVHLLNAEVPVVVGLRWPTSRVLRRTHLLSEQAPRDGYAHAVTLVGYECESGRLEDVVFIFRNSWGYNWGVAGYGFVTVKYLQKNYLGAVFLSVGSGV